MPTREDCIAVFDSGVGGISVLRQLVRVLPEEKFLYFGDSANAPYGTRPTDEVRALTLAAAARLMGENHAKALVVACNTATSAAIDELRRRYPDRIIIGIEPALKLAAEHHPGGRIGVMATDVTLREEKFDVLLHRFDTGRTICRISAPGLVELIESGGGAETEALLRRVLRPYIGQLDALVLGCTHYPFVRGQIAAILGADVEIVEGGPGTARETRRRLAEAGLLRSGAGSVRMENSAGAEKIALSRRLLGTAGDNEEWEAANGK